jgi:hypothetical protein
MPLERQLGPNAVPRQQVLVFPQGTDAERITDATRAGCLASYGSLLGERPFEVGQVQP